ncbi:hypothetical protein VOLCADRAFT_102624 [Volvox carteri f. nagariensis]|uniref:Uncharacterized protein n=1 Tax=Volvox carteri f. nagariensis TaxID=3068 RepID=D8TH45_VOLCA|nr:uncharacterized protein VOLCADRAFT_102624 [Volvox carteri f. nagariensis]EFJ53005.1 hypothetical protein VOLCADRAFT_102624 [Volvox carteri f. nagariensis]|eukprot:XP_002946010.1 hypothetical protein VOLCADRAFT_102624 [Volvox carteri f. nagariensis]
MGRSRDIISFPLALCAIAMSVILTPPGAAGAAGATVVHEQQEAGITTITTTTTIVMHNPHRNAAEKLAAAAQQQNSSEPLKGGVISTDTVNCAMFVGRCGAAAYQAYRRGQPSLLFACASRRDVCACVDAFGMPLWGFLRSLCDGPDNRLTLGADNNSNDTVIEGGCPAGYDRIPADGPWCYSRVCPPTYSLIESTSEDDQKRCYRDCDLGWEDRGTTCYVSVQDLRAVRRVEPFGVVSLPGCSGLGSELTS